MAEKQQKINEGRTTPARVPRPPKPPKNEKGK